MRITPKTLAYEIKETNIVLIESGSNFIYEHGQRYNYQALDFSCINSEGVRDYRGNVECGTSRECLSKLHSDYHNRMSTILYPFKASRKMAKGCLSFIIDFDKDYFTLSTDQKLALILWAKKTGYKRPSSALHGLAYYFFQHLIKRVKI